MSSDSIFAGKLMVVGAHAGDAENMAGATILKHTIAGHQAFILHMTLGEAGHPTMTTDRYAEQRKQEVLASAKIMRATTQWFEYPDGRLPVNDEVKLQVCDLIRCEQPTVILTHWKGSFHKDHIATHEIVRDAVFYAALPAIQRELPPFRVRAVYYPENWEDMEGWRADIYLDTTAIWKEYLEVLQCHEFIRGNISTFRYLDYYNALGTVRGCLGGFSKAVALMVQPGSWIQRLPMLPGFQTT